MSFQFPSTYKGPRTRIRITYVILIAFVIVAGIIVAFAATRDDATAQTADWTAVTFPVTAGGTDTVLTVDRGGLFGIYEITPNGVTSKAALNLAVTDAKGNQYTLAPFPDDDRLRVLNLAGRSGQGHVTFIVTEPGQLTVSANPGDANLTLALVYLAAAPTAPAATTTTTTS